MSDSKSWGNSIRAITQYYCIISSFNHSFYLKICIWQFLKENLPFPLLHLCCTEVTRYAEMKEIKLLYFNDQSAVPKIKLQVHKLKYFDYSFCGRGSSFNSNFFKFILNRHISTYITFFEFRGGLFKIWRMQFVTWQQVSMMVNRIFPSTVVTHLL